MNLQIHSSYRQEDWFQFLDHGMKDLVIQAVELLRHEVDHHPKSRFHDYSFIVFPIARAYEGFLKKYFLSLELIDEAELYNPHFRIGRSLNPDLPEKYKDRDWLFDDVHAVCSQAGSPELADRMWRVWRQGRNQLFHYFFPDHARFIDLGTAQAYVLEFMEVMETSLACDPG